MKSKSRISIIASIVIGLFLCCSTLAESLDVLSIDYPPYTAEADAEKGPLFSLLQQFVEERLPGKTIRPVFVPPARAALLLSRGEYCLSFYPPQDDSEAFEFIHLSDEKVRLGLIRLQQPEPFSWKALSELEGKSLAILRPYTGGKVLRDVLNAGMEVVYVESNIQGLRMLSKRRVDYAFGDNKTLPRLSAETGLNKELFQFSDTSLHETIVGINVRKSCNLPIQTLHN